MSDDRKDLPPASAPNFLEKVREALQTYLGNRGDRLDRGLTIRDLADAGMIDVNRLYLQYGGKTPPITGPGPAVDGSYEEDLTPPPMPTGFTADAAITNLLLTHDAPTYTQGHGHARTIVYGATWTSGALPVFANAVPITEFTGTVASHATNPSTTWHLWIKWKSVDGVLSTVPAGGINGVVVTTGQNVELLLNALNNQLTSSQLHSSLSTRINLIDADFSVAGSVAARLLAEADARTAAILAETNARSQALLDETNARVAAIDAEVLSRTAAIADEALARALADGVESSSREALATQFRGAYTGNDLAQVTSGLFYQERITRASNDDALSQQITLLSAGAGEQFDYKNIWYFDTGIESWTGNGTPTAAAGWIRPANHATDPYVESPTGIDSDGYKYSQVRMRVRKTGNPVWGGYLWWRGVADSTWDVARRVPITEPTYDGNGIGVVSLNPSWTGVIDRIRVDLSDDQAAGDYMEMDWVAIGRPSPGASSAQLLNEEIARANADAAEVTARQSLATKVIGTPDPAGVTLANLTSGVLFDERTARSTADASEVTARQTLATKMTGLADPSAATLAGLTSGLLYDERVARSTAVGSEVTARETLATQLRGGYAGTDINALTSGMLYTERVARVNADGAMASQISELFSSVDDTQAALTTEETTRASADSALSSSITSLTTTVNNNDSAQTAALQNEATTRANADIAESNARTTLAARVTATEGNISINAANLVTEQNTRASADSALASRATALEASVNSGTTGLATKASVTYVDQAEADAISTAASATQLVQAQLNTGGTTQLAIAAAQTQANTAVSNAATAQTTANTAVANAATAQTTANTAVSNAATAQTAANTANTALTNLASDGILSPSEKPSVVQNYTVITGEQAGIDAQATSYGITTEKTNYDAAVSALTTYLNTLTGWNVVPGSDVVIVGTTFRSKFADVYTKRQLLLDAIAAKAKVLADTAQAQANTATTNAATAQTQANTAVANAATAQAAADAAQAQANTATSNAAAAQSTANTAASNATTANNLLADIASDSKLTPVEKSAVRAEWDVVAAEKSVNNTQATTFSVTTENTTYNNAFQALANYLNAGVAWSSGIPSWISDANLGTTTTIVGATFRATWKTYYDARTALLNAIALKAKTLADAAQAQANTATTNAANAQSTANTAVDATTALATRTTNLEATVNSGTTGLATKASIAYVDQAEADAISASANSIQQLQSKVDGLQLGLPLTQWKNLGLQTIVDLTDGKVGTKALQIRGGAGYPNAGVYTPIDRTKKYRVRFWARPSATNTAGLLYFSLRQFLSNLTAGPVNGGRSPYKPSGLSPATHNATFGAQQWGEYSYIWDVADWQTGAAFVLPEFLDNYSVQAGYWEIQGFEFTDASVTEALSSSIQVESTTRASQTGELYAKYTVKLDVNGYVSGFGLASTLNNATPYSQFIFKADQFAFGAPGLTTAYPFVIQASATTVNGVAVPAGVYMDAAYIKNGTITNVKIGNAAIDDAKIANLSAAKITAGSIAVGQYIQSSGYVAGSAGWRINGNGVAEFSGVTVRGTVYATNGTFTGTITGSTINGTTINSGDINVTSGSTASSWGLIHSYNKQFNDGTNGWILGRLGSDGSTLFEVKGGANRIWMNNATDCGIQFPGITMTNGGLTVSQLNVINTPNIGANAASTFVSNSATTLVGGAYTAQVSITLAYTSQVVVIGQGQSTGNPYSGNLYYDFGTGFIQASGSSAVGTCVLVAKYQLTAGTYSFKMVITGAGGNASIIVMASTR
jgi:hypothetical protein